MRAMHGNVAPSTTSLPRYLFTGRTGQVLRHLPSFAKLYWRLFRDRRVSVLPKALLVLIGVYLLSPFDVLPEFLPIVGTMDDVAVLLAGLWLFVRLCPPAVVREQVRSITAEAAASG
jgi:uncharacterized membrane protein YkvA (DUF1232 family)